MLHDLYFLWARFRNMLIAAMGASLCIVIVFIDVELLDNVVPEASLTECIQAGILVLLCVLYWRAAAKNEAMRPGFLLIGGFFLCMFLREMDS